MKIDVVIGNPPYNNDIYIPFVEMGHSIASTCSVFITPAKWQAKGGKKNEAFRQNIVPHMSKIVYYPDTTEIFDIREVSGICYYLIDKQINNTALLKINIHKQKLLSTNGMYINSSKKALVDKNTANILDKLKLYNKIPNNMNFTRGWFLTEPDYGDNIKKEVAVYGGKGGKLVITGYKNKSEIKHLEQLDKYKICTNHMAGNVELDNNGQTLGLTPMSILKPMEINFGGYYCIKVFDTEDEALSFQSYFNTKFVRFLATIGKCGTALVKEFFRFVPDPGAFDHIFTDEELYKKYNLTPEEINIIESVIKERK
jgi:site-specific DNA-methyltransferase (adenine-specific)